MAHETTHSQSPLGIPDRVRGLLNCPKCRGMLSDLPGIEGQGRLACPTCAQSYPVHNGVPWLIPEQARDEESR